MREESHDTNQTLKDKVQQVGGSVEKCMDLQRSFESEVRHKFAILDEKVEK